MDGSLRIDGYVIDTPIADILKDIKSRLTNGKLKDIRIKGDNIIVTCPHDEHKGGREMKPSCSVYSGDSDELEYGWMHCFSCGEAGPLWHFVGECFDKDDKFGKQWLIDHFGSIVASEKLFKGTIDLDKKKPTKLDDSILENFQNYHPYMTQRKILPNIIDRFKIKYDQESKAIVFPVWDKSGELKILTRRSVEGKRFILEDNVEKPVYLLNEILKENITKVYVTESQINTLTLWGWGYPAVGLFGTGSKEQYNILKQSGIIVYYLCFDGDDAGDKGTKRFKDAIGSRAIIRTVKIPRGKDVNDLTKEEFEALRVD